MLGTPPAFVLSQDQTLVFNPLNPRSCCSQVQNSFSNWLSFLNCDSWKSQFAFFLILYRFQGSSLSARRFARADSSVIISQSRPSVNTFFELFWHFLNLFAVFRKKLNYCWIFLFHFSFIFPTNPCTNLFLPYIGRIGAHTHVQIRVSCIPACPNSSPTFFAFLKITGWQIIFIIL